MVAKMWVCTDEQATYCPLCGDCTCQGRGRFSATCPLHGYTTVKDGQGFEMAVRSRHGTKQEMR